ncbi:MAG: hypothetical protein EP343_01460 [Deltaproteobacteria bacterium]|nr:MAG: hypothetical protein EP343_01460 [Deltaproteobacteria bacterium]
MSHVTNVWIRGCVVMASLALVCQVALFGCGGGRPCNDAGDCISGEQCISSQCVVTQPQTCQSNGDCKANQICEKGQCTDTTKPECTSNSDCPSGQECQEQTCKVPPKPKCTTAQEDCKPGQTCESGVCKGTPYECTQDTDCKDKTKPFCSSANKCEWECKADSDCIQGYRCDQNRCVLNQKECSADADCKGKARQFCSDDGNCEWSCRTNQDCKIREKCNSQYICEPRTDICKTNAQCQAGEVCWGERCLKECDPTNATGACPTDQRCLAADSKNTNEPGTGVCTPTCTRNNPVCPKEFFCTTRSSSLSTDKDLFHCYPAIAQEGTVQYGERCETQTVGGKRVTFPPCDGRKDLVCMADKSLGKKCAKACIPWQGLTNNPNCKSTEKCYRSNTHLGGLCFPTGTQKAGDVCTESPWDGLQCEGNLYCSGQSSKACQKPCDDNNPCPNGEQCKEDLYSHTGRGCVAPSKAYEICNAQQLCEAGLTCAPAERRCVTSCKTITDCPAKHMCVRSICLPLCIEANGKLFNPDCPRGTFCSGTTCKVMQGDPQVFGTGPKQQGESCSPVGTARCDAQKGLLCDPFLRACLKACDPFQGVASNAACQGAACLENTALSYLGGACELIGTAKQGEACHPVQTPCAKGLACKENVCAKVCDPRNNQGCGANEFCYQSTCIAKCDTQDGVYPNTTCPKQTFCASPELGGTGATQPYCRAFPAKESGLKTKGQSCSALAPIPTLKCNGSKELFCDIDTCQTACDPALGFHTNGACASGESCILDDGFNSPLGGKCFRVCDPKLGWFTRTRCAEGTICEAYKASPGVCIPKPKLQGPKEKGEACNTRTATSYCNGNKGLFCSDVGGTCLTACNPRKSNTCPTGEVCKEHRYSFLGGACEKAPTITKKLGESCTQPQETCDTGLRCIQGFCRVPCDQAKGLDSNPDCSAGQRCRGYCYTPPSFKQGTQALGDSCSQKACDGSAKLFCQNTVCVKACDPSQGTSCASKQRCVINHESPLAGICELKPTQKVGEACAANDPAQTCQAGLFCYKGTCVQACDPNQSSTCKAGEHCAYHPPSPTLGGCTSTKLTEGQPCSNFDLSKSCDSGLLCLPNKLSQFKCVKPSQKLNQFCDDKQKSCVSGLSCWGGRCLTSCDPKAGTSNNKACQTTETCHYAPSVPQDGVCLP